MKLGIVVVTHGQLATELVNSAEMIVGDLPQFAAVSIGWHDDVDHAREEIGRAIARVAGTAGTEGTRAPVLVLTDMFGGTPANLGVTFVSADVEVITGVNLPMLIKLARPQTAADLLTVAREMREHGRNAIWVASDLLRGDKADREKISTSAEASGENDGT
jgi:PTS system mannose-specific IIA component